jgi:hypothetical protein
VSQPSIPDQESEQEKKARIAKFLAAEARRKLAAPASSQKIRDQQDEQDEQKEQKEQNEQDNQQSDSDIESTKSPASPASPKPLPPKKPARVLPTREALQRQYSQSKEHCSQIACGKFTPLDTDLKSESENENENGSDDENDDEKGDGQRDGPGSSEHMDAEVAEAVEALANLCTTTSRLMSTKLPSLPLPTRLNDFSAAFPESLMAWCSNVSTHNDLCLLCGPKTRVSLLLQAYAHRLKELDDLNAVFAYSVFTPPNASFLLLEKAYSLCGLLNLQEPPTVEYEATAYERLVAELARVLMKTECSVIVISHCASEEELNVLGAVWYFMQQQAGSKLRQIVIGLRTNFLKHNRERNFSAGVELSLPENYQFCHPLWPNKEESPETRAIRSLSKCILKCSHPACVFKNRQFEVVSHDVSLWDHPAVLNARQMRAIMKSSDQLLKRHLFMYRRTGDFFTLLTCVVPSELQARDINAFFSRHASNKVPASFIQQVLPTSHARPQSDDLVCSQIQQRFRRDFERLSKMEFYSGQRVVLLAEIHGQSAGSLGTVCGCTAHEVNVWFDASQLIIPVGLVSFKVDRGERHYRVTMIPLDTAFAVTPSFFSWGQIGEVIACGVSPEDMQDMAASLLSAQNFYWTPESVPIESDSQLFAGLE